MTTDCYGYEVGIVEFGTVVDVGGFVDALRVELELLVIANTIPTRVMCTHEEVTSTYLKVHLVAYPSSAPQAFADLAAVLSKVIELGALVVPIGANLFLAKSWDASSADYPSPTSTQTSTQSASKSSTVTSSASSTATTAVFGKIVCHTDNEGDIFLGAPPGVDCDRQADGLAGLLNSCATTNTAQLTCTSTRTDGVEVALLTDSSGDCEQTAATLALIVREFSGVGTPLGFIDADLACLHFGNIHVNADPNVCGLVASTLNAVLTAFSETGGALWEEEGPHLLVRDSDRLEPR